MQIPCISLSLTDSKVMVETGEKDCERLTNQALKSEVIMSSFSCAGEEVLPHFIFT